MLLGAGIAWRWTVDPHTKEILTDKTGDRQHRATPLPGPPLLKGRGRSRRSFWCSACWGLLSMFAGDGIFRFREELA